jgi:transcriptional regulator with XRE-family HTH domain
MMGAASDTLLQISEKIREIRTSRNLTLKELSDKTGLSISFLSQVERGASSLAIVSLEKIADALCVNMVDFLSPTAHSTYVVRQEERKEVRIESSMATYIPFSGQFVGERIKPMMVILQPNQNDSQTYQHPGEEFYYVMEGEVIFILEDKEFHLTQGDTIHFPSELPHSWRNPLTTHCKLISVSMRSIL